MNYSELLQLAKGWSNFKFERIIIWRLPTKDLIISFHSDISPTGGSHLEFKKGDFSKVPKEDPQIGMTTEEVLNSTWGEPDDINKDTYSWGVKEQWCYPNNRIFLNYPQKVLILWHI